MIAVGLGRIDFGVFAGYLKRSDQTNVVEYEVTPGHDCHNEHEDGARPAITLVEYISKKVLNFIRRNTNSEGKDSRLNNPEEEGTMASQMCSASPASKSDTYREFFGGI